LGEGASWGGTAGRLWVGGPYTRGQEGGPYTRGQEGRPYTRGQEGRSYTRGQEGGPYTRGQEGRRGVAAGRWAQQGRWQALRMVRSLRAAAPSPPPTSRLRHPGRWELWRLLARGRRGGRGGRGGKPYHRGSSREGLSAEEGLPTTSSLSNLSSGADAWLALAPYAGLTTGLLVAYRLFFSYEVKF
jgi:hypothetical protein